MSRIFDKMLVEGIRKGHLPGRTRKAREWFREQARKITVFSRSTFLNEDKDRLSRGPTAGPGSMYMFSYDPKLKEELPYYDKFPMVFITEMYNDGFLGINLHYLPPRLRANLMDQLYETTNNQRYDQKTKLKINYQTLKRASKFKLFEPCVKKYLYSHVQSKFMYIYPTEWDIALMLPLESFEKLGKQAVWSDSKRKVGVL